MELRFGQLFERTELVDAGVVDQHVELAVLLLDGAEHAQYVGFLGEIALQCDGVAAGPQDLGHGGVGAAGAAGVVDDDGGAVGRQLDGDGRADAFRGAGHEGDLVCELFHGVVTFGSGVGPELARHNWILSTTSYFEVVKISESFHFCRAARAVSVKPPAPGWSQSANDVVAARTPTPTADFGR